MPNLYSRYIFKQSLIGFLGLTSILVVLIWFSRAVTFVRYVTENGVSLDKFLYLFVLILPWLLLFIIPFSLFFALILVYNRLISSNEITILKNSGLTKFSIAKPALYLGALASLLCFLISFYLMPYANKELRILRKDLYDNYANLSFNSQTFESLKEITIYTKGRDRDDNLSGIIIHDERNSGYSITITAESGRMSLEAKSALLYLENGTLQKTSYGTSKTEILNFDNYVFNFNDDKKNETAFHWKPKERYLHELLYPEKDTSEIDIKKYRSEFHQRFTQPLFPIILSLIAISCMMRGAFRRHGNISNIILAITLMIIFLSISLSSYDAIESNAKFTPILYINFLAFFIINLKILNGNFRRKK